MWGQRRLLLTVSVFFMAQHLLLRPAPSVCSSADVVCLVEWVCLLESKCKVSQRSHYKLKDVWVKCWILLNNLRRTLTLMALSATSLFSMFYPAVTSHRGSTWGATAIWLLKDTPGAKFWVWNQGPCWTTPCTASGDALGDPNSGWMGVHLPCPCGVRRWNKNNKQNITSSVTVSSSAVAISCSCPSIFIPNPRERYTTALYVQIKQMWRRTTRFWNKSTLSKSVVTLHIHNRY